MQERDGVASAVWIVIVSPFAATRPANVTVPGGRRQHRVADGALDVDPAMLPGDERVLLVEDEALQHRPRNRPRPRAGRGRGGEGQQHRDGREPGERRSPLSVLQTDDQGTRPAWTLSNRLTASRDRARCARLRSAARRAPPPAAAALPPRRALRPPRLPPPRRKPPPAAPRRARASPRRAPARRSAPPARRPSPAATSSIALRQLTAHRARPLGDHAREDRQGARQPLRRLERDHGPRPAAPAPRRARVSARSPRGR